MESQIGQAARFAARAHSGQRRKYTGMPYLFHCAEVAGIVQQHGGPGWLVAAGWLHDTIEDTDVTLNDLKAHPFDPRTVKAVDYMTERDHEGNRATRKAAECQRLERGSREQQTLKLADLISNTPSIVEYDPKFARVYLREMEALLNALRRPEQAIKDDARFTLVEAKLQLARIG